MRKDSPICSNKTLGKLGIDLYYGSPIDALNLWTEDQELDPPCVFYGLDVNERYVYEGRKHKVWRWYQGNLINGDSNTEELWFEFLSEMTVIEQVWSYGFMAYIAENGGFVGLFLGYSVLNIGEVVNCVFKWIEKNKNYIE